MASRLEGLTAARIRKGASRHRTRRRGFRRPVAALALLGVLALCKPCDAAWRQTRFLISGWGGSESLRDLARLEAAGIDFVHDMDELGHGTRALGKIDSLRAAGGVRGVGLVLQDPLPPSKDVTFTRNKEAARNWTSMKRRIETMGKSGGLLGYLVWDEPCSRADMTQIGETVRRAVQSGLADRTIPYVNLLGMPEPGAPSCYDTDFGGATRAATYTAYLDAYLSQYDTLPEPAPFLSLDSYPFVLDGKEGAAFFETLSIARDRANAYGRPGMRVPLWVVLQLANFRPRHGKWQASPTPAQLAWQAWTAVAYGAKSISWWTLSPAYDNVNDLGFGGGLLGADGKPTTKYADVRKIDAALHALGPVLMGLDPIAVFHVARGRQQGIDGELLDAPGRIYDVVRKVDGTGREDCMIGYFKDRTTRVDHLLVVNKSLDKSRTFALTLGGVPRTIDRFDEATGRPATIAPDGTRLAVTLPPASARLFRMALPDRETLRGLRSQRRDGNAYEYVLDSGVLRVDESSGRRTFTPVR